MIARDPQVAPARLAAEGASMVTLLSRRVRTSAAWWIAAARSGALSEEVELRRLAKLPRRSPGTSTLRGMTLGYADAPSFVSQFRDIFQRQCYRFEARGDSVSPSVVDCGANLGLATLYWKRLFPGAQVLAIEPDPDIRALLERNLQAQAITGVEVIDAAAWIDDGSAQFQPDGADSGSLAAHGSLAVRTVRLRDLIAERRPELLKVDIEGAEVDVLVDCSDVLPSVKHVFVEYHSFAGQTQRLSMLFDLFAAAGHRVYVQSELAPQVPFEGVELGAGEMDMRLNIFASSE
jgi:FkbM family methyltransferase